MKPPIFIMGTQRSGTTLLTRILSAHPQVFIQNEIDLPYIFDRSLSNEEIVNAIKERIQIEDDISLDQVLAKRPNMIWGLKDPQLTEHIDELRNFLPTTKFIVIVRDGRGVTNSYIENKWGLGTNVYTGALRWKREVDQQQDFMAEAPDKFLYLHYEGLVNDLEGTMRKVCKHLEVDFHPAMLEYDQQTSYYQKKRENINTFAKPKKELAGKWKKKLSSFEIDVIEHVAGDTLKRNKYTLIGKPINLTKLQILYFTLHQKIIGEIQLQYRWKKSAIKNFLNRRKRLKQST